MDIIRLLVIICVVALVVWLIERYTPIDAAFKTAIRVIAILACGLLALRWFGLF